MVITRPDLTLETWTTRMELARTSTGGIRASITVTHDPVGGGRVVRRLQRGAMRGLVQRTVHAAEVKVPAHVAHAAHTS